jgi:hypothetical protein
MFTALAFDRAMSSGRFYDADGRLHVGGSNISRAEVNGYTGREIPDWQKLGLSPWRVYQVFRDPVELEAAAPSFDGVQLLSRHIPVDANDHRPDLVVGAVSNPVFEFPFLKADLVIWSASATGSVESGEKAGLSAAYRYVALIEPGTFEGVPYELRMTSLCGNHVALVDSGRVAGAVIGDSAMRSRRVPTVVEPADFNRRFREAARIVVNPY